MEYKNIAPFINRQEEMAYIQQWIEEEPKSILFFYGPKSSGKTTLIYKFVDEHLSDEKKFSVKLFNLREVLLVNYEDFLECFFEAFNFLALSRGSKQLFQQNSVVQDLYFFINIFRDVFAEPCITWTSQNQRGFLILLPKKHKN